MITNCHCEFSGDYAHCPFSIYVYGIYVLVKIRVEIVLRMNLATVSSKEMNARVGQVCIL